MSNLENNTASLRALLDKANALPDSGGSGGIDTSDATASESDILSGKTAYVDGEKITGTIATKTSSDLSASGATVTVPAGYYASQVSKSVATATQATPSISVDSSGLITASATQSTGYVSAGTKSATKQLTTQAAKTITPSTSSQTAVASGVYTTGVVKVAAIPSSYVKPSATKSATTYTPGTSNQTIASGTYCSGTQTIKGDSNLVASNIKSGVSIFGVAGSYEGSGSGGGTSSSSFKTCTLSGVGYYPLYYTTVENNEIVFKNGIILEDDTESITVLCDSIIYYARSEGQYGELSLTGGFELLYNGGSFKYLVIKTPSDTSTGTFAIGEIGI